MVLYYKGCHKPFFYRGSAIGIHSTRNLISPYSIRIYCIGLSSTGVHSIRIYFIEDLFFKDQFNRDLFYEGSPKPYSIGIFSGLHSMGIYFMRIFFFKTYSESILPITMDSIRALFYKNQIYRDRFCRRLYSIGICSRRDPLNPYVFYRDPFERASILWRSILLGSIL